MITLLPNHDLSRNDDIIITIYVIITNFNPTGENYRCIGESIIKAK
jgi:hypothetical protein